MNSLIDYGLVFKVHRFWCWFGVRNVASLWLWVCCQERGVFVVLELYLYVKLVNMLESRAGFIHHGCTVTVKNHCLLRLLENLDRIQS